MFVLKGLKVIYFVDKYEHEGTNYDEGTQYVLTFEAKDEETRKLFGTNVLQISMWEKQDSCYSGYCVATTCNVSMRRYRLYHGFTHLPKPEYANVEIKFDIDSVSLKLRVQNKLSGKHTTMIGDQFLFEFSEDGNDEYYPSGFVRVNMEGIFNATPRAMEKRPTYIYYGESGIGKSHVAHLIEHDYEEWEPSKVIFETDQSELPKYPNHIYADIIVLGNKHKYSKEDIAHLIPPTSNPIFVHFFHPQ